MKFNFLSFLILTMLAFSACEKGDLAKEDSKADFIKDEKKESTDKCFDLTYPISYTMPDGSTVTGDDEEAVESAVKAWYEAHPDSKEKPALVYPVEIVFADGTTKPIASEEEMELAKKDCEGDKEDELKVCEWDGSKVSDPDVWEEYIVEPLVTDEACGGCTVAGVVRYVKIDSDFAYEIYYGKGECDEWAYLVTYYDADDKKVEKCKFKLDCDPCGKLITTSFWQLTQGTKCWQSFLIRYPQNFSILHHTPALVSN